MCGDNMSDSVIDAEGHTHTHGLLMPSSISKLIIRPCGRSVTSLACSGLLMLKQIDNNETAQCRQNITTTYSVYYVFIWAIHLGNCERM